MDDHQLGFGILGHLIPTAWGPVKVSDWCLREPSAQELGTDHVVMKSVSNGHYIIVCPQACPVIGQTWKNRSICRV